MHREKGLLAVAQVGNPVPGLKRVGDQVGVGQADSLGLVGGAAGVEDGGQVSGCDTRRQAALWARPSSTRPSRSVLGFVERRLPPARQPVLPAETCHFPARQQMPVYPRRDGLAYIGKDDGERDARSARPAPARRSLAR